MEEAGGRGWPGDLATSVRLTWSVDFVVNDWEDLGAHACEIA